MGMLFWRGRGFRVSDASSNGRKALHIVYINTGLKTKASSASVVPTIACTSSNVLHTMLQARAQRRPGELRVCYGPNTYMGENLIVAIMLTIMW